eukprot:2899570-Prymnesium_polylepis.1
MRWREWINRCGQGLFFSAYRWAHLADSTALLTSSEAEVLNTLTLTNAEAYHNLLWEMAHNKKVPLHGIGVQAHFQGPVDASTVKHRLDVLREVQVMSGHVERVPREAMHRVPVCMRLARCV